MTALLFSWIGTTDLKAAQGKLDSGELGPVGQAVAETSYDEIHLLSDHPTETADHYCKWLRTLAKTTIMLHRAKLASPTDFGQIYENACRTIEAVCKKHVPDVDLTFHLSPGTPAMAAVWIILAKTRFRATLIESSKQHGVKTASVPFNISADYLPDLLRKPDEELILLGQGLPPQCAEFDAIIHESPKMSMAVLRARRVAPRSIPVLLLGESGTGKELFARAIHRASPRRDKPFVAVNCGAIPHDLVDAELFGHEKGAFTGATVARPGHILAAHEGTLFLDEIGELPLPAQVRLLRVLQDGLVTPVGATKSRRADFRLICATNRDLPAQMQAHRFREDLFHRIAVAVIHIPPLRERGNDIALLLAHYVDRINRESAGQPGHEDKHLSVAAKKLMLAHDYPGNIRELINILQRAIVWSSRAAISAEDIRDAMVCSSQAKPDTILDRPLGESLDLQQLLGEVAGHYLRRAIAEARGNKTLAAQLVGLPSYQTLTNWLHRYGIPDDLAQDL